VLEGPAGIGKTTLLDYVRQAATDERLRVLSARAPELERDYPFGVVRQWLEPVLAAAATSDRRRLLDGAAALAEGAVQPGLGPEGPARSPAVLHGIYWLLANLASEQPLLLLLDDTQWADEPSLRLLNHLAPRLTGLPLALVIACRPPGLDERGELLARLIAEPSAPILRPGALTMNGAARLLRDALGQEPEPAFVEAGHAATGGNPFYLRELARELADQGACGVASELALIAQIRPRSLSRAILMRISPSARALACALAVLEEPADLDLAANVAKVDAEAARAGADELDRAGLITAGPELELTHAIVRAAVMASISAAERTALHRRAAATFRERHTGPERVAIHLLATEPAADLTVVATLRDAAGLALGRGAPEVAARLLRRALDELPPAHGRDELLLALADAEQHANEPARAAEHLWELYRTSTEPTSRGEALRRLPLAIGPDPSAISAVVPALDRTITEVAPSDPELALRLQAMRLGVSTMLPGKAADRDALIERVGMPAGNTPGECVLLAMMVRALMDSGHPAHEVLAGAQRAIANHAALEVEGPGSIYLDNCATALRQAERFDLLDPFLDRGLGLARQRGSMLGFDIVSVWRSLSARWQGTLAAAEAEARGALDAGALDSPYRIAAVSVLVDALVDQGKLEEADAIAHMLGIGEQVPAQRPATTFLISRGALRHAGGERRRALADLNQALARIDRYATSTPAGIDARVRLVTILRELGHQEQALTAAERALTIARRWGTNGKIGMTLCALATMIGGAAGLAQLHEAVELLADSPLRLEYARALVELGAALRRAGHRSDCRPPLREGLELAERAGATPLAQRARDELNASGARVPRQRVGDPLTPSEHRIVEMAARGQSNPQIAQALFVTTKTVESHLANAYRKLGINSRRELTPTAQPNAS
jgi:DNA-binding CsgD family transcriptional regulator